MDIMFLGSARVVNSSWRSSGCKIHDCGAMSRMARSRKAGGVSDEGARPPCVRDEEKNPTGVGSINHLPFSTLSRF